MAKATPIHDDDAPVPGWLYTFLLEVSVSTTVAYAALPFSGAAVGLIVGTSQVQLAKGTSGDLLKNGWFLGGVILAGIGVVLWLVACMAMVIQSRARRESPLRIVFDENDLQCVKNEIELESATVNQTVSVRVRNMGHVGLQDVRLKVIAREPPGPPQPLRLQYDIAPYERSLAGETCSPDERVYFDVAQLASLEDSVLHVAYANDGLWAVAKLPRGGRSTAAWLSLKAEGRREDDGRLVPPAFATFKVYMADHENLCLGRLNNT